ncbi:TldD/PmbA family protein, partial [Candidatus Woesearchaeota archaeon]|nr:TldD/PmbA family protein [Candidatus Woesearchaeota archaeon]
MEDSNFLKTLMRELKKKGADDIVLELRDETKTQIKFSNNEIAATKTWDHKYVAIMFAYNQRMISSSLERFDNTAINNFVKKAISFAKAMEPNKKYQGIAEGPFKYKKTEKTYDKKILDLHDKSIDIVESAINTALSIGAKRCNGVFDFACSEENLLTSSNVEAKDKGTALYLSFRSHVKKDESGYYTQVCRVLSDFDPEKSGRKSAEDAVKAKAPKRIPAKKYDVIMDPYPFG